MSDHILTQQIPIEVRELAPRATEGDSSSGSDKKAPRKRFAFVGATETGVNTPWGREHLRMSGVRLDRYRANPVVLDGHDRSSALAVIGRAQVKRDGGKLVFENVEFADTARAREIEQLVTDGFLRAVSIGFTPDSQSMRELSAGEVDGEGPEAVTGPATVIKRWELVELSVVPVGADQHALRRSIYQEARHMAEDKRPDAAGEQRPADETREAAAPSTDPPAERARAATLEEIRAITPPALMSVAERCMIEGRTLEEVRAALLEEHARRHPPVGTPEPPEPRTTAPRESIRDMPLDEIRRALAGR